jgi:ubiquinone/menaquinone biosynthesis C-methylase UbiE
VKREFKDRTTWYDGYLFEKIMDKRSQEMFVEPISAMVEDSSSVIDIGCGIGSLVFNLSHRCSKVVGIDVSSKMISYAKKRQVRKECSNVEFYHLCASLLTEIFTDTFDYVIMGQILHETSTDIRERILEGTKRITQKMIISDYRAPLPHNMYGVMIRWVEYIAGSEHNKNFKSWQSIEGIDGFISRHRLKVEEEIPYRLGGNDIGIGKIIKVSF